MLIGRPWFMKLNSDDTIQAAKQSEERCLKSFRHPKWSL